MAINLFRVVLLFLFWRRIFRAVSRTFRSLSLSLDSSVFSRRPLYNHYQLHANRSLCTRFFFSIVRAKLAFRTGDNERRNGTVWRIDRTRRKEMKKEKHCFRAILHRVTHFKRFSLSAWTFAHTKRKKKARNEPHRFAHATFFLCIKVCAAMNIFLFRRSLFLPLRFANRAFLAHSLVDFIPRFFYHSDVLSFAGSSLIGPFILFLVSFPLLCSVDEIEIWLVLFMKWTKTNMHNEMVWKSCDDEPKSRGSTRDECQREERKIGTDLLFHFVFFFKF